MGMGQSDQENFNDINITPFVDVVLVLLVIFMVAAPVMVKQVLEVKLPSSKVAMNKATQKTLGISILASGQVFINGTPTDLDHLGEKILSEKINNLTLSAVIAADTKTEHGMVIKVINIIKSSGINDFAFQVEKEK